MPYLTQEEIANLSSLSHIKCTEEEIEKITKELTQIIEYAQSLQEVDTSQVEPCNHVVNSTLNNQRNDTTTPCLPTNTFLNNAPSHIDNMIKVPPIINKS